MTIEQAWQRLQQQATRLQRRYLRDLFAEDRHRFQNLSFYDDDITADFSKERLDAEALDALLALACASEIEGRREAMVNGPAINATEQRAVLHMALRGGAPAPQNVLANDAD